MKKYIVGFFSLIVASVFGQQNWSIEECIAYAAQNNLTIKENQLNQKLFEQEQLQANNGALPTVSGYLDNNFTLGSYNPIIDKGYYQFSNAYGIQSSVNIFNGGQVKLNKEKAQIDLQAAQITTATTLNDVSLQIANYYLAILLNRELKSVALGNQKIAKQLVEQTQKQYNAGAIAKANLVQTESELAAAVREVTNAQIEIERATFNLAMLLQLADYRSFSVKDVTLPNNIQQDLYNLEDVLAVAYEKQPAIKYAELKIESAMKSTQIFETFLKPKITGTYSLGTNYMDYFNKGIKNDAWLRQWRENVAQVVGVSVSFPIWNQYTNKTNIQKALINEDVAKNQLAREKQQILQNVQSAYFEVNSSYASYEAAQEAVRYADISFSYAQKSFNAGVINLYDFNRSRNDLLSAQSKRLQSKYNFIFKQKVLDFYAGIPLTLD